MNSILESLSIARIVEIIFVVCLAFVLIYACISGYMHMKQEYEERQAQKGKS